MSKPDQELNKKVLEGYRGGLAAVLCVLIIQLLILAFTLWTRLFGFDGDAGAVETFAAGGFDNLDADLIAYVVFSFASPIVLACYSIFLLVLFFRKDRRFSVWFLAGIALAFILSAADFLWASRFGKAEPPVRTGLVVSFAVYQWLLNSPRAKGYFVNPRI